jgi:hypothetical protein
LGAKEQPVKKTSKKKWETSNSRDKNTFTGAKNNMKG